MSVAQTNAAKVLQQQGNEISPHQVIALLLNGAMERISQAKHCVESGNEQDKLILVGKIIGIINGLRASLNLEAGGDIAVNLNTLYLYMSNRLEQCDDQDEMMALQEVGSLIDNIKQGWDGIANEEILHSA